MASVVLCTKLLMPLYYVATLYASKGSLGEMDGASVAKGLEIASKMQSMAWESVRPPHVRTRAGRTAHLQLAGRKALFPYRSQHS